MRFPRFPTAPNRPPVAPAPAVGPTARQVEPRRQEEEREGRRRTRTPTTTRSASLSMTIRARTTVACTSTSSSAHGPAPCSHAAGTSSASVQTVLDTPKVVPPDVDPSVCNRPHGGRGTNNPNHTVEVFSLCPCLF